MKGLPVALSLDVLLQILEVNMEKLKRRMNEIKLWHTTKRNNKKKKFIGNIESKEYKKDKSVLL